MEDFSLNENGELYIKWNINSNYAKLQFNELIASLIHEFKHTGGVYDAFVQNDGKLIGNEKVVIIRNMRDIIQISVTLKNFLITKYIKNPIPNQKINFKFLDEYSFQLSYKYTKEEILNVKSVKFWYEQYFKIEVLKFTEDLKKALEDKVITEEEAVGLVQILDQMILGAAILYDKLMHENLMN
jgi:hypothetical protein